MKILLYIVLILTIITIIIMLFNRIYFEINLATANRKLNKALKEVTNEQVKMFTNELKNTLYIVIDALTDSYAELAENMDKFKEER